MPAPPTTKIGVDINNRPVLFDRYPILELTVIFNGVIATQLVDQVLWTCPTGQSWQLIAVTEVHAVAGSDGGAVTLQVTKDVSTDAPGAGTDLLSTALNLKSTANTPVDGALVTTTATVTFAAGNRLSIDFAGTLTALQGVNLVAILKRLT